MGCHAIKNGIICLPNIYVYKGFTFEFHDYLGSTKLKKDFNPCEKQGRKFYKIITEWTQLTNKQKKKTKVYG